MEWWEIEYMIVRIRAKTKSVVILTAFEKVRWERVVCCLMFGMVCVEKKTTESSPQW